MAEIIDLSGIVGRELFDDFKRVAEKNGFSTKEIMSDFMKDFIVSDGHPELVVNRWPWNKQK